MAMAKVWNDWHEGVYEEEFKGEKIRIPAGQYIEMDHHDAIQFLGQYIRPRKTDTGILLNHKKLRLDVAPTVEKVTEIRCQVCRGLFASENELILHSDAFHKEKMVATASRAAKEPANVTTK